MEMIKLSKYQIGTLSIIEIKQCDSTQGFSMFLLIVTQESGNNLFF